MPTLTKRCPIWGEPAEVSTGGGDYKVGQVDRHPWELQDFWFSGTCSANFNTERQK